MINGKILFLTKKGCMGNIKKIDKTKRVIKFFVFLFLTQSDKLGVFEQNKKG